eukprot:CAMPEP_0170850960 /NCGR_PEP_ID=MMETSP0734-20130129/10941_1 /TAXON_ID=186038 /ORGANISM="Fragilariopsis kerguelensis, Strain L26-C5" /LENGTH=145 /DNA_ID=CAMNT_0011220973 /DNA_START=162 /DNA_END=600 /DNA_ORIENTATION=+
MPTEKTSFQNTTPAGDSSTTNEMVIGKINTYQRTFLIVAGYLLALLVLIAVGGTIGGQPLQSSANEIAEGAVAVADYQVDSASLALTNDIFGVGVVSENKEVGPDPIVARESGPSVAANAAATPSTSASVVPSRQILNYVTIMLL